MSLYYSLELCILLVKLSLSPLPYTSLLFSAICKASPDNHFACLHFFFFCIETWNLRFMNQCKLDIVKQETTILNIDILGISELKWMRWANLLQMTIISTNMHKNHLEEMEWPSYSTKEYKMQYLGAT